jgi:hypothetical protein
MNRTLRCFKFSLALCLWCFTAIAEEPAKAGIPEITDKLEPVLKREFSPRDIEIQLQDGSLIRGELASADNIILNTAYGALAFPVEKILRIDCVPRLPPSTRSVIATVIRELDNNKFTHRTEAQQKIESFGVLAIPQLKDAQKTGSAETRARIEALLKKLASDKPGPFNTDDIVATREFEAAGSLQISTVAIKSKLGCLSVSLEDIAAIRWLGSGDLRIMDLDAGSSLSEWMDTEMDLAAGTKTSVLANGTVTLLGCNGIGPAGNPAWNSEGALLPGSLIGKIGADGDPFSIGKEKRWTAEATGRLFVKISCSDELQSNRGSSNTSGKFHLRIATGVYASQLGRTGGWGN